MQQHGSKYFARSLPPPALWVESKGQNSIFSKHGNVVYQIKWNHKCSNIIANIIVPAAPPPPRALWVGSIGQYSTVSKHGHVVYQIEWNHKCSNMIANIVPADSYCLLDPGGGSKGPNSTFFKLKHSHIVYQIK